MKIETFPQDDHQVKIEAEFDAELFDGFKRRAARKIAKQAKIPGFRPGKAPYDVILRIYGEGPINEEAIELLVDDQYAKVLEEASVEPSGPGSLQEIVSMDPVKLSFLVPLKPEVVLGNYKDIEMEYNPEPVTDEDVSDFLTRLQKNYATAEPVERPIEKGDVVYFKLSGTVGDETVLEETPVQLVIGDDEQKDNWPYKNFSKKLIGMSEGESKDTTHTFGENEPDERFQSKKVKFTVNVESVKALSLPELDDEFANNMGQFENIDELKEAVHEQLESNKKQEYDDKFYSELIGKYTDISTVKFPPFMVEEEIHHMIHSLEHDLQQQNMDFETYLKLMNLDRDKYIEENVRPGAISRVTTSLIIEQLAQEEKVQVAKEDIDGIVSETIQMLQNSPDQRGKKNKVTNEMVNNVTYNAISRLYNQRTLEHMKAMATGEAEEEPVVEEVEEAEAVVEEPEATVEDATENIEDENLAVESEEDKQSESNGEESSKED